MAIGGGEGVGGIEEGHTLCRVEMQHLAEHSCHLLHRGRAVARDGLLDLERRVFVDGHVAADGGGNGNALRTPQFEHALHVLAEEGSLDGQFVGQELLQKLGDLLVDAPEFEVNVLAAAQVDDTHGFHLHAPALNVQHAVAQHVGAGVDAEDYLVEGCMGCFHRRREAHRVRRKGGAQ